MDVSLVCLRVLLNERLESFDGSFTIEIDWCSLLIELESGEACDFDTFGFVGSGIEVSDNKAFNILELSGKVLPERS